MAATNEPPPTQETAMGEVTSYAAGTPSWVDLMTSDPEAARGFYGELFGWDYEIGPPDTGHYTMVRLRGRNVAGMGGDPAGEGMPTVWTTYIAVDDLDAAAQRVGDNGGQVMMGPMDVMTAGRMAIASDPTGAVFGMWQAGDHIGASLVNEPGAITWNELATRDLDAVQTFYAAVFGYDWSDEETGEGGPPYKAFKVGDRMVGGALQMTEQWPAEIPAHWMPYFGVTDTDTAAATAQRLGGSVLVQPTDSPYGRFAVLRDPQGAVFTIMQMGDQPDA
jgi:hypothetical protein